MRHNRTILLVIFWTAGGILPTEGLGESSPTTAAFHDVAAAPKATVRQSLEFKVSSNVNKNLFWDVRPVIDLVVENHADAAATGIRCDVRVEDLYYQRDAWTGRLEYPTIPGGKGVGLSRELPVPYGVFRVHWTFADAEGTLGAGTIDIARMLPRCYRDEPESVRAYERRWGIFGGVYGFYAPELASDMGTRWVRYEDTVWSGYEKERGRFEMGELVKGLKRYKDAGIESVILQTLYQRPAFHNPDRADFAPAYGQIMRQMALAARGLCNCFELGNEDNGPTKMLYGEVARQAAAGIRSVQPDALIANSGTAYVDVGWLRMQAGRGAFDVLDVLCTHPYTADSSPEAFRVYEQLGQVDELIDELGGMKIQWTTEFGWHHDFNQQRRAEWIPRHHVIGAAAGIVRHGLYTWERDFGVFQGTAQPSAASVHALMKMIEGHRFAGLISRSDELWAAVFERAGTPLAVAWSPGGKATWSVEVTPQGRAFDLFGNPLPVDVGAGRLEVPIGLAPVYVTGVGRSVLEAAIKAQCSLEHVRFVRCLKAAKLPPGNAWERLAAGASVEELRDALVRWTPSSSPVGNGEQAVVAQALRWYLAAGRPGGPAAGEVVTASLDVRRRVLRQKLAASVAGDADIPSLRWLLEQWDRLADEHCVAKELKADGWAASLAAMQETAAVIAERFLERGERVLFGLWPYLYTLGEGGTLKETLRFVPGEAAEVGVRVSSFSATERAATVTFELPEGWRTEPEALTLTVPAGGATEGRFRVQCPSNAPAEKPTIRCVLRTEGAPNRVVPFDDIVMDAPVRLAVTPVRGLLPGEPIRITITSSTAAPMSGLLRLMRADDSRALARVPFTELTAERPLMTELKLRPIAPLPYHEWPLIGEFILGDGRRVERTEVADFACAVRAEAAPIIDADLSDWGNATPLCLDREEYAKGSYGGKWSAQDLSATTYVMWDDNCFYFAARVTDQTFNQNLSGPSQWTQDSIQLALARDDKSPRTEIGLALTPKGEEVVRYTSPGPEIPGCRLKVKVQQGGAIYEAAIPWKVFGGLESVQAGVTIRYAVVVNDDDAIMPRRFLERYGGIARDKEVRNFGYLTLVGDFGKSTKPADPGQVFIEDFEEYAEGKVPDAWRDLVHEPPIPETKVVAGAGRDGSKGLVLVNTVGTKPHVYRNVVRPLAGVRPNENYELRCRVRGRGVEASEGIIGVCSDLWGNESFCYASHGAVSSEWKEIVMPFGGPTGGRLNLIIRNASKMDELVVDDIRVVRAR